MHFPTLYQSQLELCFHNITYLPFKQGRVWIFQGMSWGCSLSDIPRIIYSLPSLDGRYIIFFHPFPSYRESIVIRSLPMGEGKVILSLSPCDLWDPLDLRVIFHSWELNLESSTSANISATFTVTILVPNLAPVQPKIGTGMAYILASVVLAPTELPGLRPNLESLVGT